MQVTTVLPPRPPRETMRIAKHLLSSAALLCLASPAATHAATLCVDSQGNYPCFSRISDAVAYAAPGDTIRVGSGTYYEYIFVHKPVSLVTENAVIDAQGLRRGFEVNGLGIPGGLSGVNISGFTVRNAQFEGILLLNATVATVSNNTVINNDQAAGSGTCRGLEDFEGTSTAGCGGGIHLIGADHSVVTSNTVQGNSSGILISDDTGPAHENLISFNTVTNNGTGSGITLTSNAATLMVLRVGPAQTNDLPAPVEQNSFGVYHNTIYGNRSKNNGLVNGLGAGIRVSTQTIGGLAYGNVVIANLLAENAQPGVVLFSSDGSQDLNDNLVVGNTVVSNGAYTGGAVTSGPTGVAVDSAAFATGNMVVGNTVQLEATDVAVATAAPVQVQFNALQGSGNGVANLGRGSVVATQNFWSCPIGPTVPFACSGVFGPNVQTSPWLSMPAPVLPAF